MTPAARMSAALLVLAAVVSARAQQALGQPGRSAETLAHAVVDAHNHIRAPLGVPPLVWSQQLAAVAQDWANTLIATRRFAHSPGNRYGENLYAISGAAASPAQVIGAWAAEARGYDVRSGRCSGVCGHYTQIVWRATRAVGCGVASDPHREVWVCEYDPPGNVIGYRPY
jgi:uncharacterized protein YkwD